MRAHAPPRWITRPTFGNGCTFSPDGFVTWKGWVSFVPCCQDHDLAYARGGDEEDRRDADRRLRACIACRLRGAVVSAAAIAWTYYLAVRRYGRSHFSYKSSA